MSMAAMPSVHVELHWAALAAGRGKVQPRHPVFDPAAGRPLRRAVDRFWDDGGRGLEELPVYAHLAGQLFEERPDGLLDALPEPAIDPGRMRLETESRADRDRILDRLERLRSAPRRRAYGRLLRRLWTAVREDWLETGLPAVLDACARWRARFDAGERVRSLPPGLLDREPGLLHRVLDGSVVLVPGHLSGRWLVLALPDVLVVGFPASTVDAAQHFRDRVRPAAGALRVLSDPTRLAMLAHLAHAPSSVTELAAQFRVSQPTASFHVGQLAGLDLLEGERRGPRTLYRVRPDRLRALLDSAADRVLHP
ncbi:MAG TPA: metalloregulator ArsR/SmtB family transcription factor [Candidatus Dormibacteraeota bacterium]